MDEFIQTLTEEQKQALLKALSGGSFEPEVPAEFTTHPPFIDGSRWQHEEPISEAVDGPQQQESKSKPTAEDFTMRKDTGSTLDKTRRREAVKARANTWTDTGEHKDISTPEATRTPRNRPTPKKKDVTCHICGKKSKVNASLVYGEFYRCDRCTG